MKLNRREFLTTSAVAGIVCGAAPVAHAFTLPDPPRPARLRLSCQEGVAPGRTLAEKLDFLEANGFEGLEPGGGGLKVIGYQDFVSFECGCKGDPTKAIPSAVKLLREQWEMA